MHLKLISLYITHVYIVYNIKYLLIICPLIINFLAPQVKNQLKQITKGSMGVSDELAILGAAVDDQDLSERILEGLGDDYKELARAVQARDTPISFDEPHEKLLNFEASLQNTNKTEQSYFPASANPTNRDYTGSHNLPHSSYSPGNNTGYGNRFSTI